MVMDFLNMVWSVYLEIVAGIHNHPDIGWFAAFFSYLGATLVAIVVSFGPIFVAVGLVVFAVKVALALAPIAFLLWVFVVVPAVEEKRAADALEAAASGTTLVYPKDLLVPLSKTPVVSAPKRPVSPPKPSVALTEEQRVAMELELEDMRVEREYQEELIQRHRKEANELARKTQQGINEENDRVLVELDKEKKEREKLKLQLVADCSEGRCVDVARVVFRTSRAVWKDSKWSWLPGKELYLSGELVNPSLKGTM
jgi:hypothetical protein